MSSHLLGILLALGALLSWGFGDFFIQRATRAVGVWKALFWNELLAVVVLSPFAFTYLRASEISLRDFLLLAVLSLVVLFAALFDFEALKEGKIAIVEPLLGIELPLTIGLSVVLVGEHLSLLQSLLAVTIFIGIILAVTTHGTHLRYHRRILEKGVILAGLGAIAMALMNFLVGVGSQTTSPLFVTWFYSVFLMIACGLYLAWKKEIRSTVQDFSKHAKIISLQAVVDNAAWVFYAFATILIPISIATSISESYIALAALLGVFVNREHLQPHQIAGIILAIGGVIVLATISSR